VARGSATRRACLRAACAAVLLLSGSCIDDPVSVDQTSQGASELELVWETFDQRYPSFAVSGVDWDAVREEFLAGADTISDRPAMIALLADMLGRLESCDIVFLTENGQVETFTPEVEPNYDMDVLWSYLEPAGFQWIEEDIWGTAVLDSVPYILILSWGSELSVGDLDSLLEEYADAPALVIDVRMNGDIAGTVAIFPNSIPRRFVNRFNAEMRLGCLAALRNGPEHDDLEFVPISLQGVASPWDKPVIILAGRGSAWLTELFACMAGEIPTVTLVGDTTQGQVDGTYSLEEWFGLPGGEIYRLPFSTIAMADSTTFLQGSGLPPDVRVQASPEDFAAGVDPVLEYALDMAKASDD
jgi:hypothetical protein